MKASIGVTENDWSNNGVRLSEDGDVGKKVNNFSWGSGLRSGWGQVLHCYIFLPF